MSGDLSKAPTPRMKGPGGQGLNTSGLDTAKKMASIAKDVATDLLKGNLPGAALKVLDGTADLASSMDGNASFAKQLTGYTSALGSGNPLEIAKKGVSTVLSGGKPDSGGGTAISAMKAGETALGAADKALAAVETGGDAIGHTGTALQTSATAGKATGGAMTGGGALISLTGIGALVGVPMKVVGKGLTAASTAANAGAAGLKVTGTTLKTVGKIAKLPVKVIKALLKTLRKTTQVAQKVAKTVRKVYKVVSRTTKALKKPLNALRNGKERAGKAFKLAKRTTKTASFPPKALFRMGMGAAHKAKNLATGVHDLSSAANRAGKGDIGGALSQAQAGLQKSTSVREVTAPAKQALSEGKALKAEWGQPRRPLPSEARRALDQRLCDQTNYQPEE